MLLLIDGMYLVFSSFYAHINMRTFKGFHTGALYGFINRIEGLIKELSPGEICVAFDSREKTFRHRLYPEYKAGREDPPQEMIQQLEPVFRYLKLRNINMIRVPGFEADDIIAQIALSRDSDGDLVIFSGDKDLFQLVGGPVTLYHPKYKQILDAGGIEENFGFPPEKIIDYLSLVGDSSDNIPGVRGIGPKTAGSLLRKYGSLQGILDNRSQLSPGIQKKISDNLENLELSRKLVDLKNTPRIPPEELKVHPFRNEMDKRLYEFFRRFSFNRFIQRFAKDMPEKNSRLDIKYHLVTTRQQLQDLKKEAAAADGFGLDLETEGLCFFRDRIAGLSITLGSDGYYIPFIYPAAGPAVDFTFQDFKEIFSPVFSDAAIGKTGHNLKFDLLFLIYNGIEVRGPIHDTMVMSYLINPKRRNHKLKSLTLELLHYRQTAYEDLAEEEGNTIDFSTTPLETIGKYCIDDAYLATSLKAQFLTLLKNKGLQGLYEKLESPLVPVLTDMELTGIRVDVTRIREAGDKIQKEIREIEKKIRELAGYHFNINSPQQVGELLFEKMALPAGKKTRKTGSYSTDNQTLQDLSDAPVVEQILLYRKFKKLLSTYLIPLEKMMDTDQRVHTQFNQTITATGRLSSSHPNLQNIPVQSFHGINIRHCFVAEKPMKLLSADYSQIELRVMAHFSADPGLQKAFRENRDIHRHTADLVFGDDQRLSPAEKRKRAKIINFSIIYGSGPYSLSRELGVPFSEAREFIGQYFNTYRKVKDFIDRTIEEAMEKGYVTTLMGRRREVPEILSDNSTVRENGKRIAVNTIIQGSAADIIKKAMVDIHRHIRDWKSRLILQVHDELIFEYPLEEEKKLLTRVTRGMEQAVQLKVPLTVDVARGLSWGELK